MPPATIAQRKFTVLAGILMLTPVMISACSNGGINSDTRSGLVCVDDSKTCIERRQQTLKHLISDPDRSWIRQRASPKAYASGVRMFALKSKKPDLTCEELKLGRQEAARAPIVMKAGKSAGLTPAQISRTKMLAQETARDLGREIKRRCK